MKVYNIVIVDDEELHIETLMRQLSGYDGVRVVGRAGTAKTGQKVILAQRPDLLFLDVELPGTNGLKLLNELRDQITWPMQVVFYTAYEKYLLEALRASAFDYLLKPFEPNDLRLVMTRFFEHCQKEQASGSFRNALSKLLPSDSTFMVATISGFCIVRQEQIGFFTYENDRRLWKVHLNDRSHLYLRRKTVAKDVLSYSFSFLQVSQTDIINISYLAMIRDRQCIFYPPFDYVTNISISRKYILELQERLSLI